jgi:hypothetical protein
MGNKKFKGSMDWIDAVCERHNLVIRRFIPRVDIRGINAKDIKSDK